MRRAIAALTSGECSLGMDNGAEVRVRVVPDLDGRGASIDFSGTSAQLPDNFNAPAAVGLGGGVVCVSHPGWGGYSAQCRLPETARHPPARRSMSGRAILPPWWRAIRDLAVPPTRCSGRWARWPGRKATMNNFLSATRRQSTKPSAAARGRGGVSTGPAVQTHMTNSRMTDPEVLERRYPVRLE